MLSTDYGTTTYRPSICICTTIYTYSGLDYFGPITVSIGRRTEKRWVALFTCLTKKAVHLEIAQDLSVDSCMRNFINYRGVPVV